MRRAILVLLVLLVGATAVFVYTGLSRDREFQRLIALGDRAARAGQTIVALEAYSGALALRSESMVAYLKRGETYQQYRDLPAALRDLSIAAELDPTATRPHERLGDVAYELRRYDEAAEHYTYYVELDDQNPRVLYKLALVSERAGRVAHSIPLLRRALALDADFAEAHYLLGLCLTEQERLNEARDELLAAVEFSPGFLRAREALAAVYRGLDDLRGEFQQLDALAALDQDHPQRHVTRGLAYARAGQMDLSALTLGRTAKDHPDQPHVHAALGQVWLDIAESRDDPVALDKALEALLHIPWETASSEALTLIGRALALDGDDDGARRAFRRATARFPLEPTAFVYLARLEEQDHNWDAARRLRHSYEALTGNAHTGRVSMSLPPAG